MKGNILKLLNLCIKIKEGITLFEKNHINLSNASTYSYFELSKMIYFGETENSIKELENSNLPKEVIIIIRKILYTMKTIYDKNRVLEHLNALLPIVVNLKREDELLTVKIIDTINETIRIIKSDNNFSSKILFNG